MTAKYQRDTLLSDLREGVIRVTFTRVRDGQNRVMDCTLMTDFLPESYKLNADNNFHNSNPEVLAVWDMGCRDWRAFRIDNVNYVETLDHHMFT
jgi:WYL_2, Sm-like SH3 beta-barrel fold